MTASSRIEIAIVVQRYGASVNGGAEQHARWLAERLTTLGNVTVLTTCALDYHTWADHFPAGDSIINGVTVRRFPVDAPRNWKQARKSTRHLLLNDHSLQDELAWIKEQGPLSTPLFEAIAAGDAQFDAYIFFTYLYASTYFGLPLVNDKAILVPTAHDDPFLQFELFRPLFHQPRAIAYNTAAEQAMVNAVMGNADVHQITAGIGINTPPAVDGARFRQKYGIDGDFLLYIGRIDQSKNVAELIDYFLDFRQQWSRPLKLVLGGKAHIDLPTHPDIVPLGFISEQDKFDGMTAAAVLMMPSLYESLSMVTLEAWLMGTPVLVNANCTLMKEQVRLSNAGLYYHNPVEFETTLRHLLENPRLRDQLGRSGRTFVKTTYDWSLIVQKYADLFTLITAS